MIYSYSPSSSLFLSCHLFGPSSPSLSSLSSCPSPSSSNILRPYDCLYNIILSCESPYLESPLPYDTGVAEAGPMQASGAQSLIFPLMKSLTSIPCELLLSMCPHVIGAHVLGDYRLHTATPCVKGFSF